MQEIRVLQGHWMNKICDFKVRGEKSKEENRFLFLNKTAYLKNTSR